MERSLLKWQKNIYVRVFNRTLSFGLISSNLGDDMGTKVIDREALTLLMSSRYEVFDRTRTPIFHIRMTDLPPFKRQVG